MYVERKKREALQTYLGDVQWAILTNLLKMGGSKTDPPSYSETKEKLYGTSKKPERLTNEQTMSAVVDMLAQY